jgi:predicted ATPase
MVLICQEGIILSNSNQPRLLSFTLSGSSILGDEVTVSLSDGVAVLVGRNGAGKSAILEGFEAIASRAIGKFNRNKPEDEDSIPKSLVVRVLTPTNRTLQYQYKFEPLISSDDDLNIDESVEDNSEESLLSWEDKCEYIDGNRETLWHSENNKKRFWDIEGNLIVTIFSGSNSFRTPHVNQILNNIDFPIERKWFYQILSSIRLLGKDPVRRNLRRKKSILEITSKRIKLNGFEMADNLSRRLFRVNEKDEISEVESICQRIGLGDKIEVIKYFSNGEIKQNIEDQEYVSQVFVDRVNIGLLSDGTLRVISILVEIITSLPGATIMIEEPEMQLHPGMLSRFLNEIEAYIYGKNLIISTHSPEVVSWTSPDKINLIHREDKKTTVRKLGGNEIDSVYQYLSDEGTLGELVYSGFLDE